MRVGIEKGRSLVGHHLLQDRGYRLPFGEPLSPDPGQEFCRIRLVEHDRACRPTIGERETVQVVENSGRGRRRETYNGQDAQMRRTEHWLEPAGQRPISEQRVEV